MVKVTVTSGGKTSSVARGLPITLDLPDKKPVDVTVADLKKEIAAKFPRFHVARQKLSLKDDKKALADEISLKDAGVEDDGEVVVKDLGPQIGWRAVYLIEYAGPLVFHPLLYNYPRLFYGQRIQHSALQKYVYTFIMLHFIKRELETAFVHRFSHGTMPFSNIFKNCFHYHVLGGIFLAYALYSPTYASTSGYIHLTVREDPRFLWGGAALWLFGELSNLHAHLVLRSLRPAGTRKRGIPYGYGFDVVSCPNYLWETFCWLSICVITNSYAAWIFFVVGTGQMALWAIKKHRAYKKEFGKDYPKGRKAMIPFIL